MPISFVRKEETTEDVKYYLSMGWWVFRIAVVIFILIPGTIPFIIGYLVSTIYSVVDPDFILLTFIRNLYRSTLGSFPLVFEILIIQIVALSILFIYIKKLRQRNPNKSLGEIGIDEFDKQLKKLQKPEKIHHEPIEVTAD